MSNERLAALLATEGRCPRCGALREPEQRYCLECGLHLPPLNGAVPALRRGWIRRVGWYPGDWIWISAVTFLVAVAGAAGSIVVTNHRSGAGDTTIVELTTTQQTSTQAAPTTPATTTVKRRKRHVAARSGGTLWPRARSGWTVVLGSYPLTSGRADPLATAGRAARSGLPDVGVLDSSEYASLHPGYYVVFTGIYSSEAAAQAALNVASASGFSGAYPRQVSR